MEYKSKTNTFGKDAEHYLAELYSMNMNLPGSRKPDLNNDYLFFEVKSGRKGKGSMVDDQLHYSGTPKRNDMFPQKFQKLKTYYVILERTGDLITEDIKPPFYNIKITWGNQHILPGDLAFSIFAVETAFRIYENRDIKTILADLNKKISEDSEGKSIDYKNRRSGKTWQNLDSRMINAILEDDTKSTVLKEKLSLLKEIYPVDSLKGVSLLGPNNTEIKIVSLKEDFEYFNSSFNETIHSNVPKIEEVSSMRANSSGLLEKILSSTNDLFGFGINGHYQINLNKEELDLLKKLSVWKK